MQKATYQQQAYTRIHVETANPGRILLTLYDAAIRFVRLGQEQIEAGNMSGKGITLSRAYAIIAEFIHALDHDKAPELCQNLESIYGFILEQLAQANSQMDAAALTPVLKHLTELRETWGQAVSQAAMEAPADSSATVISR